MTQYEWKVTGDKYYYYETKTGKIVGLISKIALSEIYFSLAYVGQVSFTITDEKHLGQYVTLEHAKEALINYWFIQSMTLIEE